MKSKFDVLECLTSNRVEERVRSAVQAAVINLQRSTGEYQTTVGLPVLSDQLLEIYRHRLARQHERGLVDLGLPETVEVLAEGEREVKVIHCSSEFSNIVVFCESATDDIVGCIVFPLFLRPEN